MPAPAFSHGPTEQMGVNDAQPIGTKHSQKFRWESRFGMVLIEVQGSEVFVNGCRVEPVDYVSDQSV